MAILHDPGDAPAVGPADKAPELRAGNTEGAGARRADGSRLSAFLNQGSALINCPGSSSSCAQQPGWEEQ